jgi:hypothetical protein
MKTIATLIAAASLAAPVLSFAQSADQGLTCAQVRAEPVQLERVGRNPSGTYGMQHPVAIQGAEATVMAANKLLASHDAVGGMPLNGTSQTGDLRMSMTTQNCVGPVSYCNVYFGS